MSHKKHPLISFQAVSKTYGEDPLDFKSLILKNIHLNIHEGEFVIVFGPSGSGKSSVLNLMAGLEFPTAGKIMVRNKNIASLSNEELARYHRLKMGMVFQSFNLVKSLKVWENVALPQTANGIRYGLRRKRATHLLKLFNIDQYANRRPNEISGGEQQRVAISRALINNPAFLLVDEPTGNLDTKSAHEVMEIFRGLNAHGKHTIVLVTHNASYLDYASRIVYMQDGMIVKEERRSGKTAASTGDPLHPEQYQQLASFKDQPTEQLAEPSVAEVPAAPSPVAEPVVPVTAPVVQEPVVQAAAAPEPIATPPFPPVITPEPPHTSEHEEHEAVITNHGPLRVPLRPGAEHIPPDQVHIGESS